MSDKQYIDVRSPAEFEEYALAGAVNIPLFNNEERAIVGTIYKQEGKQEAIKKGMTIVGPKLASMYEKLLEIKSEAGGKELVVYCWRGGMRSGTFVSLMQTTGISCTQLQGGIRSIRKHIISDFEKEKLSQREYVVLAGGTGTGKTNILQALQEEGYPVINLEGLANHRGSAFGQIGLKKRSQKQFELLLWQRLKELKDSSYFIIEAESKRIGNIFIPDFILEGKANGRRIEMIMPLEERAEILTQTYDPKTFKNEIKEGIQKISSKLQPDIYEEISIAMKKEHYHHVSMLLLRFYYDERYEHAFKQYEEKAVQLSVNNWREGMAQFKKIINKEQIISH
ncbi:tRNA 2-selenouridine(34) synthase MnmH [Alteribacillus sp. HJP-4]|uniref:tRNA 2-selenouridine(34) synthase MnmH n=1 Tax=Alteribacillus sp. HJP-4 TaxID=2775394 RepID=UPI0035CCE8F3